MSSHDKFTTSGTVRTDSSSTPLSPEEEAQLWAIVNFKVAPDPVPPRLVARLLATLDAARSDVGPRDEEQAALDAGTHEPAVDDFGNQYLALRREPVSGETE